MFDVTTYELQATSSLFIDPNGRKTYNPARNDPLLNIHNPTMLQYGGLMLITNLFFVNLLFSNTFQSMHQKQIQNQKPTMQFSLALHMLHQVTAPFFS